jgi:hypothetical protein
MRHIGNRRRIVAIILITMGVVSFFAPLIVTNPPVVNRVRWSLLDIAQGFHDGRLPRDADSSGFWILAMHFGLIYLLLIFAAASLCFFRSRPMLMWTGVFGAVAVLETWREEIRDEIPLLRKSNVVRRARIRTC